MVSTNDNTLSFIVVNKFENISSKEKLDRNSAAFSKPNLPAMNANAFLNKSSKSVTKNLNKSLSVPPSIIPMVSKNPSPSLNPLNMFLIIVNIATTGTNSLPRN